MVTGISLGSGSWSSYMSAEEVFAAISMERKARTIPLGRAYRSDRESIAIFPRLPLYAGVGPNHFVTVFVTGNSF
jgi:hypothetical protein